MSIEHPDELAGLRAAGRVVAETLRELRRRVRPGVTTAELDTHAGAGLTDLAGPEASRTGEWRDGIGRLRAASLDDPVRALLTRHSSCANRAL